MKSLTLNRSTLSKENLAVLSKIAVNDIKEEKKIIPGQNAENMSKEDALDILWQNFKINSKEEKSPVMYLFTGFIVGVLSLSFLLAIIGFGGFFSEKSVEEHSGSKIVRKENKKLFNFNLPLISQKKMVIDVYSETPAQTEQTYTVKSGDSLESLAYSFYGTSSPEKVSKIQTANNIKNPHSIFPGQKLVIPAL